MEWNDCEITNSLKIDQENVSQIENPIIRHPKGKSPGTARFKGPLEASNEVNKSCKCDLCNESGHNHTTCS
ncbi:8332_t:CDS:2 [Rhizophagus irregularis]|nr:8332_t:CDS:2 [Rhizophagus irregularis]